MRARSTAVVMSWGCATLAIGVLAPVVTCQTMSPAAPAQVRPGQVVIPRWERSKAAEEIGYHLIAPGLSNIPAHTQLLYNVNDLGVRRALLTGFTFRNVAPFTALPAVTLNLTVSLSHSPKPPSARSRTFADNIGKDNLVVFRGSVRWPPMPFKQPSAFVAPIPFQRPFPFDAALGKSLVADIHITATTSNKTWVVAAARKDYGVVEVVSATHGCWLWIAKFYAAVLYPRLYPGGQWIYDWSNVPANAACISSLGFRGPGSTWGPYKLPIWLGDRCGWGVASELFLPFSTDAFGRGSVPRVPIPNDRRLVDTSFYEQGGCFTTKYNSIGFVTFFTGKFTIGTGKAPDANELHATGVLYKSKVGSSFPETAPIIRVSLR